MRPTPPPYQSEPSTSPPAGVSTAFQVRMLRSPETVRTLPSPRVTLRTPVCPAFTVSGLHVPVAPTLGANWGSCQLRALPLLGSATFAVGYCKAKPPTAFSAGNTVVVFSPVQ